MRGFPGKAVRQKDKKVQEMKSLFTFCCNSSAVTVVDVLNFFSEVLRRTAAIILEKFLQLFLKVAMQCHGLSSLSQQGMFILGLSSES